MVKFVRDAEGQQEKAARRGPTRKGREMRQAMVLAWDEGGMLMMAVPAMLPLALVAMCQHTRQTPQWTAEGCQITRSESAAMGQKGREHEGKESNNPPQSFYASS
jgi:hypothetical protein